MAKRNPYPVKAKTFALTKYINSTNDCIDQDFDEELPLYVILPRLSRDDFHLLR